MPFEPHEIEAIKTAVAAELLRQHGSLPGHVKVLNAIDSSLEETDPNPWRAGRRVRHIRQRVEGTVVRHLDADGSTHTVVVRWDTYPAEWPQSPSELEVIP